MSRQRVVETPNGPARLWFDEPAEPRLRLVLGHGAGGGVEARDLAALAERLPESGIEVVRVEQPWRVAGKKVAPRPAVLDDAWRSVVDGLPRDVPLVVGGRSAGARVACRTHTDVAAVAVVALAFPLHPPGKPERSRLDELTGVTVPVLVVQGDRDTFGTPAEFPDGAWYVTPVPHADHGMAVPKAYDQQEALTTAVEAVREFLQPLRG
ncbi:alpha/beta hydrolase family protein [Phytoactinopolyspora halotolerans]|uniref:Hydrolase n=1 Tax=Phytoactinopolyspora halotolerans TaxID=1981512 RepID=A0A6L9SC30_9ACTN|nr:alpha/beta family hydrolase [Phytoactinopolyspora halotolerans]NEE02569.1 hydrolase [Phytoactinopolyspora halotolerans]